MEGIGQQGQKEYKIRVDKYSIVSKDEFIEHNKKQAAYYNKRADEMEGKELEEAIIKLKSKHKKKAKELRDLSQYFATESQRA